MSITITGESEVAQVLAKCGEQVSGRQLATAVLAGSQHTLNRAKELCPVGKINGGTLRRSLHAEITNEDRHDVEVIVGTDVVYARRIELGFVGTDSLGRSYHQAAQPYLRPAMDETRDQVIETTGRAIEAQLRAVTR